VVYCYYISTVFRHECLSCIVKSNLNFYVCFSKIIVLTKSISHTSRVKYSVSGASVLMKSPPKWYLVELYFINIFQTSFKLCLFFIVYLDIYGLSVRQMKLKTN